MDEESREQFLRPPKNSLSFFTRRCWGVGYASPGGPCGPTIRSPDSTNNSWAFCGACPSTPAGASERNESRHNRAKGQSTTKQKNPRRRSYAIRARFFFSSIFCVRYVSAFRVAFGPRLMREQVSPRGFSYTSRSSKGFSLGSLGTRR